MAQINGTVVAVEIDVPVKKNGGGTYQGWSLVYKDNTGEIKTMSKHMNSLKYAQPLKNGLESLKAGDAFTLEQEKEGDFWNPKSIYKSTGGHIKDDGTVGLGAKSAPAKPAYTAPSSSTYSTVEERAQTQKYIVRQSSITAALKMMELNKVKDVTIADVLAYAGSFEDYVMGVTAQDVVDTSGSLEDLDNDIPF
jgi:hypothetical protein